MSPFEGGRVLITIANARKNKSWLLKGGVLFEEIQRNSKKFQKNLKKFEEIKKNWKNIKDIEKN